MPIGAQEELGLRMISLSMLMALSSCPSFQGESSDPKRVFGNSQTNLAGLSKRLRVGWPGTIPLWLTGSRKSWRSLDFCLLDITFQKCIPANNLLWRKTDFENVAI